MYFISVETTAGTWLQHTVGSWILCFTQAKQWFCKVIARKQQQKFNLQIYIHTVMIYLEAADDIKVSVQWNLYTVYKSMCNHNMQCTCAPQTYYYGGVLGHPVWKREAFKEIYLSGLVPVSNDVTSHQHLPLKTVCSILFSHSLPAFNFAVIFLGCCVLMGPRVLCSQQRAGNKGHHCAPYHHAVQLWSTDARVQCNSCCSLFSVFRGLNSLSTAGHWG